MAAGGRRQAHWTPPAEFDEYHLVGPLGAGGMGQVYLARDVFLDRMVAIKFLLDAGQGAALERFRIEARALARLQHPNVVIVHRIGEAAGFPYLVSEHIRGRSLAQIDKPLPWARVLEIGLGLSRGLAAAHQRGVLHRDIKAANAMLADDGTVKLLDFGLAKLSGGDPLPAAAAPPLELEATTLRDTAEPDDTPAPSEIDPRMAETQSAVHPARRAALRIARPDDTQAAAAPSPPPPASSITQVGAILGTPLYMPPEAWRGEPMSPASDVYSMGVVLFELCAGRTPWRGLNVAQLAATVNSDAPPPLLEHAPDVDPRLAAIIDRCRARDPAERYPSATELRDALEGLTTGARSDAVPEGNPYRGLQAFEAEHRALFFGRDRAIHDVVERLRGEAFVLIAGDSGAGKSSLCRAGVIPAILDGALGGERRWRALRVVPGTHALQALVAAAAPAAAVAEEELLAAVRADPAALGRALRKGAGERDGFLLFVDQLEELVTIADAAEAELFADALRQLAVVSPSVRVLATVRGDFLTRVAARFGRADELVRAVHLLLPPGRDELRAAVVDPARIKGVTFESDALVEQLVEAGARADGGLPLLQFALAQLWSARDPAERVIRVATLEAIGGVEGALARHADEVLARLLPAQRESARRVLLRLVTAEGTRARRGEAELIAGDANAPTAVDALVRGRLLVARESDDGTAYEVAHEALLRGWQALRTWHEQSRDARAVLERVERAAGEWQRVGRTADALWGERQLSELRQVVEPLGEREAAFVAASRRTLRRRRWLRRAALVAIPVVVAAVWLGVRVADDLARDRQVARRVAEAERHLGDGQRHATAAAHRRGEAHAAFDAAQDADGERMWSEARQLADRARDELAAGSRSLEAALLVDPRRDGLRRRLAALTYDRMALAETAGDAAQVEDLLARLELWDLDGVQHARWTAPATVTLTTTPAAVPVTLERYVERDGALVAEPLAAPPATPITDLALAPGSYRFTLDVAGTPIRYPVLLGRGERFTAEVALPDPRQIPAGYSYLPAGRFLFGYSGDEDLRRSFFVAPPMHAVTTGAFLIARHEVTFGDWLAFLDHLDPLERARRLPRIGGAVSVLGSGPIELRRTAGVWELSFQPTTQRVFAPAGQTFSIGGAPIDWRRLPVTGISLEDAAAYVRWLDETGAVPRARLCTSREWTRAASGADGRAYPGGTRLDGGDARIFDGDLATAGPAMVGSFPASRSPWDVDDLAGNVWEAVRVGDAAEIRGSGWYYDAFQARIANRQPITPDLRDLVVGLRVCADPR